MLKLFKYFLWVVVVLMLSVGIDQLLIRVPLHSPGLQQTQQFYVDFRTRLIGLFGTETKPQPDIIEAMIKEASAPLPPSTPHSGRYLYADDNGVLQFADSLQQVPSQYRKNAKLMEE
jgi:hypothetical protein